MLITYPTEAGGNVTVARLRSGYALQRPKKTRFAQSRQWIRGNLCLLDDSMLSRVVTEIAAMMSWEFAFGAVFILWGVFLFLQVIAVEIRRHRLQLETEKQMEEDKARRDNLLPIATASPITYAPPEIPDDFS